MPHPQEFRDPENSSTSNSRWSFWIDVGGTFTDCVGVDPSGGQRFAKVLSSGLAPIKAIRSILGLKSGEDIPPVNVRLGTTRGTNALLTRNGARVCFVTTKGFGDLLHIGFQNRPEIFAINVKKPEQLFGHAIEIEERVHFDGAVETPLDEDEVGKQLESVKKSGFESLAICLMHSYRFSEHENRIAQIANQIGFEEISLSHQVASEIRIIPRAFTTVLDAYLNPILRSYISDIRSQLHPESNMMMFSSSGSLVPTEEFTGKDSILSGPAGGVVGFSKSAMNAGIQKSIGFDMGGTSTDVSRFDGSYTYQYESQKSGIYIVAPTLSIETVAAGGGSVCHFDGMRLQVGPQSAGADPGPACYGKGGPLCISDINLYLGRIHAGSFPIPVDQAAVSRRLEEIRAQMKDGNHPVQDHRWIAEGFLKIAVAKTAEAIRLVSIQKGYDCAEYSLVAFGGAAGQIACLVADELEIDTVLVHPQAGILSAVGIGLADQIDHQSKALYANLNQLANLDGQFAEMEQSFLENASDPNGNIEFSRRLDVRYQGTETWLTIPFQNDEKIEEDFASHHRRRFGYLQDRSLEIGCLRIEAKQLSDVKMSSIAPNSISDSQSLNDSTEFRIVDRAIINPGDTVDGPVMICDPLSTLVVDRDWSAVCLDDYQLKLERKSPKRNSKRLQSSTENRVDQVQLELLNNQLFSIADQMGEILRSTAVSVNVKERLDFSCAVFDGSGDLIANAPHIPIHLGAMSECVKCLIQDNPVVQPGDVFVTNDPYRGGSHLPDITVVTPCFNPERDRTNPVFWVASRAHHAEIGGKVPGSIPPDSSCLAEEGVLIQNFKLVSGNESRFDDLRSLLVSGRYPSRQPEQNLSDIKAQLAANQIGNRLLCELSNSMPQAVLNELISKIYELASIETSRVIQSLPRSEFQFEDYLDCGAKVKLRITRKQGRLVFDFSGSSATLSNNLNANSAIVRSAIIYCLRMLIGKDIPLNQGILEPIDLVLPECFLNPSPAEDPEQSPAIVGGNVETSQRVVDVILGALEVAAASQGTSNNVIFGDNEFGYYETVCGGSGATADGRGADAIQCHITNTRITDPEILETRYPVVLEEFSIRTKSGGEGKHRGGNGVVRRLRFRRPLQLSVLSNRYGKFPPFGLHGGQAGQPGELKIQEEGGLASSMELRTPGGGGYGVTDSVERLAAAHDDDDK